MLNVIMAAAFQHVEMADKVGIRVCVRVFQGVADARLRGQMNHAIKFLAREKPRHTFAIG